MKNNLLEKEADVLETLKAAYGAHPADVLGVMRTAVQTLEQLEALFASIRLHLERTNHPCAYAKGLAEAGAYLAQDISGAVGDGHNDMRKILLAHGIECGGEA